MTDNTQSILQKLKSRAKKVNLSFQLVLQLFCQEEFLRRLSHSDYREKLILKGGLFLFTLANFESRPTMDIDFLVKNQSAENEEVLKMVKDIIATPSNRNFIKFTIKDVGNIAEQRKYHGTRIRMTGIIGNTKTPIVIDFGVGDIVIPKPETRELAVQLIDYENPRVLTYSLESTIAEKFDAIIDRMEFNSRMKDFYDIYYLATHYDFRGEQLHKAIYSTLHNRERIYDSETIDYVANLMNDIDMQKRWTAFCRKFLEQNLDFQLVTDIIVKFIKHPFTAIVSKNSFTLFWNSTQAQWEEKNDI